MNEIDWLAGLRAGSPEAIAACYRTHAGSLLQLATRLTGERADGEDVVHDVFLSLPRALDRYEERGTFGAWLRQLTVRHALMKSRRQRTRREDGLDDVMQLPTSHCDVPEMPNARIDEALTSLSDSLRQVFVLRVIEGHSHTEIAGLLGISSGASEVRLSRAIKTLRALLGDLL